MGRVAEFDPDSRATAGRLSEPSRIHGQFKGIGPVWASLPLVGSSGDGPRRDDPPRGAAHHHLEKDEDHGGCLLRGQALADRGLRPAKGLRLRATTGTT